MSATSQRVKSEEEFLALRGERMGAVRATAKEYIDDAEGSIILVNLKYDKQSPSKPVGDVVYLGVAGSVHEIMRLLKALDRAKETLIQQTANTLDAEEMLHFLAHLEDYNAAA